MRRPGVPAGFLIQIVLLSALAIASIAVLASGSSQGSSFSSALGPRFGLDWLSAVFLLLVCLLGSATALGALAESDRAGSRLVGWLGFVFILAMVLLLVARDALSFLIGWELMSLAPAAAILVESRAPAARNAVLIYMGTTHLAGVGVWLAMLYLAEAGHLNPDGASGLPLAITVLAIIGFAAKAGLVPLQFWLPRAHPLAPAPISALMSGVMIALPFYAMIRLFFEWAYPVPAEIGYGLILAGAASALYGAYSAVMAGEMKRLLAFSSIENVGLAAVALGLSVVLISSGRGAAALIALAVCLFQLAAHGFAKAALFLGAGVLGRAVGDLSLDRLGGLGRRMPYAATSITVAALSLAAVPPLAGFAAEWALLQSAIGAASSLSGPAAFAMIAVAASVGLVTGLAAFAFCKLIGLSLLGLPRRSACEEASEPPKTALAGMLGASFMALLLGIAAGWVLPWLASAAGASIWPVDRPAGLPQSAPSLDIFGSGGLSGVGLAVALIAFAAFASLLRSRERAAAAPTWVCGQPASPRLAWSGAGFAKTLRLSTTARPGLEREVKGSGPGIEIIHTGEAPHPFGWRLHRPALTVVFSVAARARSMQSGRLRAYLLYLAATLLAALLAVRIGLLG